MISARFACARSADSPSFNRALTNSHRCPRRSSRLVPVGEGTVSWMPAGSTSATHASGIHISGCSIGTMPVNRGGMTPTMVYGWP